MKDFVISFISPIVIGKTLVMYFGLNYSQYPDEGYGYGLTFAIIFTVAMLGRFLWNYRNYEDRPTQK